MSYSPCSTRGDGCAAAHTSPNTDTCRTSSPYLVHSSDTLRCSSPSTHDPALLAAIANSLDRTKQAGVRSQVLAIQDDLGPHLLHVYPDVTDGDCSLVGCCAIVRLDHRTLSSDRLSPKLLRLCLANLMIRPAAPSFVDAISQHPIYQHYALPLTPADVYEAVLADAQAQDKFAQRLQGLSTDSSRLAEIQTFLHLTADEAEGESLYLSAKLAILATCFLVTVLDLPLPIIRPSLVSLPVVSAAQQQVRPGERWDFLLGNNKHFVAASLLPTPASPNTAPCTIPLLFCHHDGSPRPGFSPDHDTWNEPDRDLWNTRMSRLSCSKNAELRWILLTFPAFHRLCHLDPTAHHTPLPHPVLTLIHTADAQSSRLNRCPLVVPRVLNLTKGSRPLPVLGVDYETLLPSSPPTTTAQHSPPPSSPSLSSLSSPSPPTTTPDPPSSPPLPVQYGTNSCPTIFCRTNGSRKSLFSTKSDGLYPKIKSWEQTVLPTLHHATHADLAWLLHNQWPELHARCHQHHKDDRVIQALISSGGCHSQCPLSGVDLLSRACQIPCAHLSTRTNTHQSTAASPSRGTEEETKNDMPDATPRQESHHPAPLAPGLFAAVPLPIAPPDVHPGQHVLYYDGGAKNNHTTSRTALRGSGAGFALFIAEAGPGPQSSCTLRPLTLSGIWLGDQPSNTNNVAEYNALLWGLHHARCLGIDDITVLGDSLLVTTQLQGTAQPHCPKLQPLHRSACQIADLFDHFTITQIPRASNSLADRLANLAISLQSSFSWNGLQWEAALQRWQAHPTMGPQHFLSPPSARNNSPTAAPLHHSPTQVIEHVTSRLGDAPSMDPTTFQRLLTDTLSRATLSPTDLLVKSPLYEWTKARCSIRPQRQAAPQDTFRVHLPPETPFDSFWISIIVATQFQASLPAPEPNPRYSHRADTTQAHGGARFGNRTWINPDLPRQATAPHHPSAPPTTPLPPRPAASHPLFGPNTTAPASMLDLSPQPTTQPPHSSPSSPVSLRSPPPLPPTPLIASSTAPYQPP